jgi:hypothetical protein
MRQVGTNMRITTKNRRADALEQIIADHAALDMEDEGCPNVPLTKAKSNARQNQASKHEKSRAARNAWLSNFMRDLVLETRI